MRFKGNGVQGGGRQTVGDSSLLAIHQQAIVSSILNPSEVVSQNINLYQTTAQVEPKSLVYIQDRWSKVSDIGIPKAQASHQFHAPPSMPSCSLSRKTGTADSLFLNRNLVCRQKKSHISTC